MELKFLFRNSTAQEKATERVQNDACNFQLDRKFHAYYRFLRPLLPITVRQMLQHRRMVETEEDWYLPVEFMRTMMECLESSQQELTTIHPWPNGAEFSLVLTHDVETAEGLKHIARIAAAEEDLGFRSSWNFVPYKYKIDTGLVRDLQSRGFEVGIHGYNHDGQLYLSRKEFDRRVPEINKAIKKFGAVGFRSPMVHRNLSWLQALEIEHESSCFDVDPFQAAPGGVGTIWPFIAGRFVELPYTLPQDHTLFIGLGERDDRIWRDKLDYIIRHQGMALMLTHPDYLAGQKESDIYFRFLEYANNASGYWHALPKEVARWWREREQAVEFGLGDDAWTANELPSGRSNIATLKLNGHSLKFVSRTTKKLE